MRLDGTGTGGDGGDTDIETYRKSTLIQEVSKKDGTVLNPMNDIVRGRVYYRRLYMVDLLMDFEWADDYGIPRCTVPIDGETDAQSSDYFGGEVYFGGNYYFSSGFSLSFRTSTKGFSSVGRGPGFYLAVSVIDDKTFDILKIEV